MGKGCRVLGMGEMLERTSPMPAWFEPKAPMEGGEQKEQTRQEVTLELEIIHRLRAKLTHE